MVGRKHVPVIVKECLGSCRKVRCAEEDPDGSRVDPLEIDCLSDQHSQWGGGNNRFLARALCRRGWRTSRQKIRECRLGPMGGTAGAPPGGALAQLPPKLAQSRDAFMRQVPGDDRSVDSADGGAR